MSTTTRTLLFAASFAFALAALNAVAPDAEARARAKTVVSFTETYATDAASSQGKLHVEARVPADAATTGAFDAATPFDVAVGNFVLSGVLGDDPAYVTGASSATFVEPAPGGNGRTLLVKLRWTERALTARISAVTGGGHAPVIADAFSMSDSGAVYDNRAAHVTVGGVSASWDPMLCVGRVYTWTWRGEDFSIVRMRGRAGY